MTAAALTACGGGEVRNDVAVSELSAKINSELENIDDTINTTYTQKETIYSQYPKLGA